MKKQTSIKLQNVSIGYTQPIQEDVSFLINEGQFIALIGRNGRGKTTLLKTISGFLPKLKGDIFINGEEVEAISNLEMSKQIALVLTERHFDVNLYVKDVLTLARTPYLGLSFKLKPSDIKVIDRVVDQTKIKEFLNRKLTDLSDGERQKVLLARALVQETNIIILDEPTAHLDNPNRHELFAFLKQLSHEQNKIILITTHEIELANHYVDELIELN